MESISLKDVLTLCKKRTYQNCVICTPDQRTIVRDGFEIRNFKIQNNTITLQYIYSKIYHPAPEHGYFVFINKIIIAERIVKRIKKSENYLDEEEYLNILKETLNYNEFHVFDEKDLQDYLFNLFKREREQNKIRKIIWNRK